MNQVEWADVLQAIRKVRHDANNPLTAALGHVQLLLDDPGVTDPEVRQSLSVVASELRRLADILGRLNDLPTPVAADRPTAPDRA